MHNDHGLLIKSRLEAAKALQAAIDYPLEERHMLAVDAIVAATLATIQAYMGGQDVRDQ
jgi:hypothetical protein